MRGATANKTRYLRYFQNQILLRSALSIRKLTIKHPKLGAKIPVISCVMQPRTGNIYSSLKPEQDLFHNFLTRCSQLGIFAVGKYPAGLDINESLG